MIRELGVEIRCGVEIGKDITIEELREQGYKGFYVAIGCQRGRKPGITGENAKGTYAAVDFLREAGAKESFALEGDVVVVGGGNGENQQPLCGCEDLHVLSGTAGKYAGK